MARDKKRPPEHSGKHRKKSNPRQPPKTLVSIGKNSVFSLLTHEPQRVKALTIDESKRHDTRIQAILDLATSHHIPLQRASSEQLDMVAAPYDIPHQGVIATVTPKPLLDLSDLLNLVSSGTSNTPPLILALDQITDPRNLGAIIRAAAGANVTAIVMPQSGSAGITPVVDKASAGTLALMDLVIVPNLVDAMKRLKDQGLWWAGAALGDTAIPYSQYNFTGPTGIVLGSEGKGLRRLVKETCDQLIEIPMAPQVESLNVSVAAGILLFEARRQQSHPHP